MTRKFSYIFKYKTTLAFDLARYFRRAKRDNAAIRG